MSGVGGVKDSTFTDISGGSWRDALKRTGKAFKADKLTIWAAALTYFGILSIFPALLVLVSILGLLGESATQPLLDNLATVAPGPAQEIFTDAIQNLNESQGSAGVLLIIGIAVALWSASGYVGAFMRASNIAWETPEGRSFFKLRPLQILVTLAMVIMLAIVALALVLTGPIVGAVGESIGIGDTALQIWDIAKWPVLLVVVILMFSILYYASPNVKQPGFKWVTPGSAFAVIVWLIASALFALYVANFGAYDKTYGTLSGVVTVLVWMWITNLALLFGLELNAERERSRELAEGVPRAEREIQLEPRAEPTDKRTT